MGCMLMNLLTSVASGFYSSFVSWHYNPVTMGGSYFAFQRFLYKLGPVKKALCKVGFKDVNRPIDFSYCFYHTSRKKFT